MLQLIVSILPRIEYQDCETKTTTHFQIYTHDNSKIIDLGLLI